MKLECTVARNLESFLSPTGALYVSSPDSTTRFVRYDSVDDYNKRTRNWQVVSAQEAKADFGRKVVIDAKTLKIDEQEKGN